MRVPSGELFETAVLEMIGTDEQTAESIARKYSPEDVPEGHPFHWRKWFHPYHWKTPDPIDAAVRADTRSWMYYDPDGYESARQRVRVIVDAWRGQ